MSCLLLPIAAAAAVVDGVDGGGVSASAGADANVRPAKLCALFPHMKDSYWLSVNQGMVEQAQAAAAQLKVMEAGGYHNWPVQLAQFKKCQQWGADVVLLGSVSHRLHRDIETLVAQTPTVAMINKVDSSGVVASVGVSWQAMGGQVGEFINQRYSVPVKALLMMGPKGRGGDLYLRQGILASVTPASFELIGTLNGSNSVAVQRRLLRQYLQHNPAPELIVAGAVAAEVAIAELRALGLSNQVDVIATYMTHAVYRGLLRGKILMANNDSMREQGRMAVQMGLDHLQGKSLPTTLGPALMVITPQSADDWVRSSLSEPDFRPVYGVNLPSVTAKP
ncbi:TMAO reductase system periplasmic protein TorT [uncultured Ferrimonas sp.]|uniref:TMAO reductase system periplasmic protein TorT n=1 Tax=uncultured Ferrimonas sp. TaxID=432640 RepID=UPI0026364443|nr:TMAO reductase system periplasmic protein TorT [uncultured Ferrimonas sp.]